MDGLLDLEKEIEKISARTKAVRNSAIGGWILLSLVLPFFVFFAVSTSTRVPELISLAESATAETGLVMLKWCAFSGSIVAVFCLLSFVFFALNIIAACSSRYKHDLLFIALLEQAKTEASRPCPKCGQVSPYHPANP